MVRPFLFLSLALAACAAASPNYGTSKTSEVRKENPRTDPEQAPTFDECDSLDVQAVTIASLSMDPYPIKFDCGEDSLYCGPPYQMNTSLNVAIDIPENSTLELVLKVKISADIFVPISCRDKLPTFPPLPPVPTRPPRPTPTETETTTEMETTTETETTTTLPVVPCSFDFNTIFCESNHTTAPWCQVGQVQGYPVADKSYNITSSFDVPWLIALFPHVATDILAGSYQLEFRVKTPDEGETMSCSKIGITILDLPPIPTRPTTTTTTTTTSNGTEAPPNNGNPSFSPAIFLALICACLLAM